MFLYLKKEKKLGADFSRAEFLGANLPMADSFGGRFAEGRFGKVPICPASARQKCILKVLGKIKISLVSLLLSAVFDIIDHK